jgi:hypothetical protein
MRVGRRKIRPLPVILPPLIDELLSSWINRHAAFIGISGMRLLRHSDIEVQAVRDLDLTLTAHHAVLLAEIFRSSPYLIRSMAQSRHGTMRNELLAINQPSQICPPCSNVHAANFVTRGARLRSWMEGWRIICPVCGSMLEDFRPYVRLFRADLTDPLLAHNVCSAMAGEKVIDHTSQRGGNSAHAILMRSLLRRQAPKTRDVTIGRPRLLDLVVQGAEDYFQRLAPENLATNSKVFTLSVRIPLLAGIATISNRPDYWVDQLVDAAHPQYKADLSQSIKLIVAPPRPRQEAIFSSLRQT